MTIVMWTNIGCLFSFGIELKTITQSLCYLRVFDGINEGGGNFMEHVWDLGEK